MRWDSFWYESIVDAQPRFLPAGHSNANFFPFYSWVSWVVALPFRAFLDAEHAFYIGALIVSSVSFLLALAGGRAHRDPSSPGPRSRCAASG